MATDITTTRPRNLTWLHFCYGDSAYECHAFLASTYKKTQGSSIPHEQEMYNMDIQSEHAKVFGKAHSPGCVVYQ